MPSFKYVGPYEEVEVNHIGLVKQGETVDVQDEDVAAGLKGQEIWEPVRAKKTAAKADDSTDSQEG